MTGAAYMESPREPSRLRDCILSIRYQRTREDFMAGTRRMFRRKDRGRMKFLSFSRSYGYYQGSGEWVKEERIVGELVWKATVPHERLKVKLRSTTAREFGFPLVTEYSQSYPTLLPAFAALTLKYDLILPLRTSSRRGKRFRDVPPQSGRPLACFATRMPALRAPPRRRADAIASRHGLGSSFSFSRKSYQP